MCLHISSKTFLIDTISRYISTTECFVFFQNVLFALGNSFLYYADQFKLYSSFCASHSKAQKVLHPSKCKGNVF